MQLTKKRIDEIFEDAREQGEYVINLYKEIIPEFDKLQSVGGFPEISSDINVYIFEKAIEYDKINHPNVISGGAWLQYGFNVNNQLKQGEVSFDNCNFVFITEETV